MQCLKCQNKWNIIGEDAPVIEKCPKCNERIIANNSNFENVSEGIYYCIIKGSKKPFDILKNKEKLNHYIDDSLGNSFPDRKLLKNAVECGVGSILFEAVLSDDNSKIEARKKAVTTFSREYSVINEKAETVIGYFCDALGWNKSSNDNSIHKSVSKKLNSENDFTPVLTKSGIKSNTSSLVIENDSSKPEDAK